jgi:hexosaminidase
MYNVGVDIVKIEKGFGVKLSTEQGRVPIYYTTDGNNPTMKSKLYSKPLEITQTTTIKAVAFLKGKQSGKIKTKELHVHKAFGKNVKLVNHPHPKYPGITDISLTDLIRGELEFSGKQWMGFESVDFEAVVDMGNPIIINSIKLGCLESQGKWIFLPSEIVVEISENGKDFTKIGSTKIENQKINNEPTTKNINVKIPPIKTQFIRITAKNTSICPDWHKGAGGKAWLFVDEIIVE